MTPVTAGAADTLGTTAAPLAQLRDLHVPQQVSFWPLAPGWWLLALVLLGVTALALWQWRRLRRRARANQYRREALQLLEQYHRQWQHHQNDQLLVQQCNQLLKRTAATAFPGEQTAALSGEAWCRFLQDSSGIEDFTQGAGRELARGPYQPPSAELPTITASTTASKTAPEKASEKASEEAPVIALKTLVARWIRQHRRTSC